MENFLTDYAVSTVYGLVGGIVISLGVMGSAVYALLSKIVVAFADGKISKEETQEIVNEGKNIVVQLISKFILNILL